MTTEKNEKNMMEEMLQENEDVLSVPKRGDIIKGKVVQVLEDEVVVDIGYKSDGVIPANELTNDPSVDLKEIVKEGNEIDVLVLKEEDSEGNILLSKKRVDAIKDWDEVHNAYTDKKKLVVTTREVVKGGIIAFFNEVRGFIPASQLSTKYVEDLKEYVNKELDVKVIEVDKENGKAIFSHKEIEKELLGKEKEKLFSTIEKDSTIEGTVSRLTNFGAFVDLGGVDGLIHISEISWKRIKHPSEVLNTGDKVEVYVQDIDKDKERISLSLRKTKKSPWSNIEERYSTGDTIEGRVVKIVDFGAFVELEPGVEGLVHISQISENHISKPSEALKSGDMIKAKIIDLNIEDKKIGLSIKDALESQNLENYVDDSEEYQGTTIGDILRFKENK